MISICSDWTEYDSVEDAVIDYDMFSSEEAKDMDPNILLEELEDKTVVLPVRGILF